MSSDLPLAISLRLYPLLAIMVSGTSPLSESDPRVQVVNTLRGQTIEIPDLLALYPGASRRFHKDIDKVRKELDSWSLRYGIS